MAPAAKTKRTGTTAAPPAPHPWWGDGDAPHVRWPGVTIEIPVRWVLHGTLRHELRQDGPLVDVPAIDARSGRTVTTQQPSTREVWLAGAREVHGWERAQGGRWETTDGRFYFDTAAADAACEFFPDLLRHHIGEFAGRPFELMEYQRKLLTRPLFGWKRVSDDLRRFRTVFGFLPKGAGKSPWAAGTGVYLARCDGEMAAEVYAIANDRNQARTVHTNAKYMVEDAPLLSDGCEILKDSIYWTATRSAYMVLSSDASSAHGKRPHGLIFDELHGFSGDRDRELFEALKKSLIKRRQPVLLMISHSGTDDEGLCHEEYDYAKGVLSGSIPDDTHLPVVFEIKPGEDWTDPVVHARVNPGYGITVKADAVETECLEAQSDPRKQNDYKRYHCNAWVNQATAWIPVEWWDACAGAIPSDAELQQYPCATGTDMAQKIDLASHVIAFKLPLEEDEVSTVVELVDAAAAETDGTAETSKRSVSLDYRVVLIPAFFLPEDTMRERVQQDRVPYDLWAREDLNGQPLLYPVEGAIIGSDAIVRHVVGADGKGGNLKRFPRLKQAQHAYDPAFATDVALALRDGSGLTVVEVLQNYKHLSEACQVFEALVKAKRVLHGGHKLLRWNLENVAVKRDDAGRIRPVKPKRATKRIDGVVASIMAISRLMLLPPARRAPRRKARIWTPSGFVSAAGSAPEARV